MPLRIFRALYAGCLGAALVWMGFNTGWGYFAFSCGLEMHVEGDEHEPCGEEVAS